MNTHKITRVSCRFFAGEFDGDGNLISELPIAYGDQEFNATIYYPFTLPLAECINKIEEQINERSEGDRAPGQEPGLQTGVRGVRREAQRETSSVGEGVGEACGDEDCWAQDTEVDGGGSHQAPCERGDKCCLQPAACTKKGEPQQGRPESVIVRWADVSKDRENWAEHSDSHALLCQSIREEGHPLDEDRAWQYLLSKPFLEGKSVCFVAYVKGIPAGLLIGEWHDNNACPYYELRHLYVTPEYRQGSVAPRLILEATEWADSHAHEGDPPIYISTMGEPRPFYKKLGFVPTHQICVSSLHTTRERLKAMKWD